VLSQLQGFSEFDGLEHLYQCLQQARMFKPGEQYRTKINLIPTFILEQSFLICFWYPAICPEILPE
jgi:hypothetical protein